MGHTGRKLIRKLNINTEIEIVILEEEKKVCCEGDVLVLFLRVAGY